MRGPLRFLLGTRLLGTYLRARLALLLAGILAVVGGGVALRIGGAWGAVALLALVAVGFLAVAVVLLVR